MYAFEFVKPASVADAVAALKDEEAMALSGGQTLIPTLKQRLAQPSKLVSLSGMAELVGVSVAGGAVAVKAATPHAVVAAEAGAYPALAALAGGIGDPAVRARGTVGGSLANNDPSACYPAAALASGATIATDKREIAADDYFQGMFSTALDEGEIITAVTFPIPEKAAYVKFVQPASRFALVGVFVARFPDGGRDHRRVRTRRVPLGRSRSRPDRQLRPRGPRRPGPARRRHDRGPPRIRRIPRPPVQRHRKTRR